MGKIVVCYVPVLHAGYRKFFEKHRDAETCFVLDESVLAGFDEIRKDVRRLDPEDARRAIDSWFVFEQTRGLSVEGLRKLWISTPQVVMPNDQMSRQLAATFLVGVDVTFDEVFLRYDKKKVEEGSAVSPDIVVSHAEADIAFLRQAQDEAAKSSDWWRHVGAVLKCDDGAVYRGYNHHLPNEYQPYFDGDTRMFFKGGHSLELSTAVHAEKDVMAAAIYDRRRLRGASLYVTTFPCPPCAKDIALFGIRELYFSEGYAVLDGERVLRDAGVKIVLVQEKSPSTFAG
jgi:dCMP deaminase